MFHAYFSGASGRSQPREVQFHAPGECGRFTTRATIRRHCTVCSLLSLCKLPIERVWRGFEAVPCRVSCFRVLVRAILLALPSAGRRQFAPTAGLARYLSPRMVHGTATRSLLQLVPGRQAGAWMLVRPPRSHRPPGTLSLSRRRWRGGHQCVATATWCVHGGAPDPF